MSVLIKGMEMQQKKYGYVLVIYPDGKVHCQDGEEYQAIPVPPHGRLIDADALGEFPYNMDFCDGGEADEWVRNAPTIIEAEEGEK